jgi:hypothetical protein
VPLHVPELPLRRDGECRGSDEAERAAERPPALVASHGRAGDERRDRGDEEWDQILYARGVQPLADRE